MSLASDERAKKAFAEAARLKSAGRYSEALDVLDEVLSRFPESPAILGTMAGVLYDAERFAEAKIYFKRVIDLRPGAELASLGLFHSLWALGEQEEAKAEVARFLSHSQSVEYSQLLDEMAWRFDALSGCIQDIE